MTDFVMKSGDPHVLLSHLALVGLVAILEGAGVPEVHSRWTSGMRPRPVVEAPLDADSLADIVHEHASARAAADWLQRDIVLRGSARGLMSPRLTPIDTAEGWVQFQSERHKVIESLMSDHRWLDLRLIGALGEPSYWSKNHDDTTIQDDGASRLEMQPRNQGSEIVGSRLRKLAATVAARDVEGVLDGLSGKALTDECGNDKPDSRTPTGLASPGPTDNALAWCALWGISQFPLAMRTGRRGQRGIAITSGHLGRRRRESFYVPVWEQPLRPARVRSILVSKQLSVAAGSGRALGSTHPGRDVPATQARAWLNARGVVGVVRFPIAEFGSDSAPERRALRGDLLPTGVEGD